ncbi:Tm-1-like ATP-binding domain-containing protein [Allokutzneria sp. A3M-2-11 16]|uniref:Tm-1-like ATP-binding domain-containing protein n=1 Tax=Allokutzneria sp. A3M-2-11 16 TaxID=2962043 RepID=UPI0020B71510|nr:Tm-1-like ATP-binding domain-containing protein [Allokutzneria sp. A3M-2-11 16]MCP3798084.1 Tm-1-like ATP-binding domain-containing protein [Allokutzneria sp. A3M-2-11 16]
MATVVLVGTLDTKSEEYAWLAERIRAGGCATVLVDAGVLESPATPPDVTAAGVAEAAGADLGDLRAAGDRGAAMAAMARGAAVITARLHAEGRLHGVIGVGGSGGSAVASAAMRDLPVGVPKLLVSTMASGDTSPYVGAVDVTMMYSVVDIAGINRISELVLGNAAAAVSSMANAYQLARQRTSTSGRPLVGASMFGVTTAAVDEARRVLDELGYEVLVFHATGSGGRSLEALAASGLLSGVLDLTTTELADDLVGGVLSAGPDRLEAAGRSRLPQVVSVGALDMVNFGPAETVPERFADRNLYVHNATVTLMRTTAGESAELGGRIAAKLTGAAGPTALFLPLRGVSAIDAEGMPFHDPEADAELFAALRAGVSGSPVELIERDEHINDAAFAGAMAHRLHELIQSRGRNR